VASAIAAAHAILRAALFGLPTLANPCGISTGEQKAGVDTIVAVVVELEGKNVGERELHDQEHVGNVDPLIAVHIAAPGGIGRGGAGRDALGTAVGAKP
jgi:hypothetical protein